MYCIKKYYKYKVKSKVKIKILLLALLTPLFVGCEIDQMTYNNASNIPLNKETNVEQIESADAEKNQTHSNVIMQDLQQDSTPSTHSSELQDLSYADDLKILSYNVYLMPNFISRWSQDIRADMILQSDIIDGHDVIILNELFENKPAQKVLDGIKEQYPHQTPVLGRSYDGWNQTLGKYKHLSFDDGGVAIVSRWPILESVQHIYTKGCGADVLSNKGFVYALLDKNGAHYHVIGTHAQAEDKSCISTPASIRKQQFTEIHKFIADKNIPADETLFIAGDFNVIKDSPEYHEMLQTLEVNAPNSYAGLEATWDLESNGIASHNYPTLESEYLDYIFVSRNHAQPSYWHNQAVDVLAPRWENSAHIGNKDKFYQELSDHYPIVGFSYADENTITHSRRDTNSPYNDIKLRNKGNGAYVKIDLENDDGWVMVNGKSTDLASSLVIDNWYPKDNAFCIMNNDYVQIRGKFRHGSYLNWWLGSETGKYAYYTKQDNSSDRMRIKILNDDNDCLKNGDEIALYDKSTISGKSYYLQRRSFGEHTDKIYMWTDSINDDETFTIEMAEGKKQDWSDKLRYKPQAF